MTDPSSRGPTRRRLLATLGTTALAGLAGCTDAFPDQSYRPPETVRTRAPGERAQPTGTPPDGEYRRLYGATAPSVGAVRAGRSVGSCYATDPDHLVTNQHVVDDESGVDVQYDRDD